MATTVTVGSKGQITLPKRLRDKHHLEEGEVVLVLETEDGVLIRRGLKSLRGLLRGRVDARPAEKEIRALRKEGRLRSRRSSTPRS